MAIELLRVSRLTLWYLLLSCFAFRVSRYVSLWHLWQFFLVTRMCFSFHFGIFDDDQKLPTFQDGVQDSVQDVVQRW